MTDNPTTAPDPIDPNEVEDENFNPDEGLTEPPVAVEDW